MENPRKTNEELPKIEFPPKIDEDSSITEELPKIEEIPPKQNEEFPKIEEIPPKIKEELQKIEENPKKINHVAKSRRLGKNIQKSISKKDITISRGSGNKIPKPSHDLPVRSLSANRKQEDPQPEINSPDADTRDLCLYQSRAMRIGVTRTTINKIKNKIEICTYKELADVILLWVELKFHVLRVNDPGRQNVKKQSKRR